MANFKGGFVFNNEAAKVEVEQSPNGALISCINPVTGESMGGGNPNSVQVIEGTLESVWNDLSTEDASRFDEAFNQGGASAQLVCDLSNFGVGDAVKLSAYFVDASPLPTIEFGTLYITNTPHSALEVDFVWTSDSGTGTHIKLLNIARFLNNEITDMSEYAPLVPTTLTIYWHPMP